MPALALLLSFFLTYLPCRRCLLAFLFSSIIHPSHRSFPPSLPPVSGILKGFDQLINLVLDESKETIRGTYIEPFFHPSLSSYPFLISHWLTYYFPLPPSLPPSLLPSLPPSLQTPRTPTASPKRHGIWVWSLVEGLKSHSSFPPSLPPSLPPFQTPRTPTALPKRHGIWVWSFVEGLKCPSLVLWKEQKRLPTLSFRRRTRRKEGGRE